MALSLEDIARHVNWYGDPVRLLANVDLFLCQVMARGSVDDIITVQEKFLLRDFKRAYVHAPPGLFTKRAWAYWGLKLEETNRPLPERFPGTSHFDWRKST